MKKAQILSVIALALALGIVIPSAGASAIISNGVIGEDITAKNTEKAMYAAIEEGKESCGYYLKVNATANPSGTKVWFYNLYNTLVTTLDSAEDAVEAAEKAQAAALKANYDKWVAYYTTGGSPYKTDILNWGKIFDVIDETTDDVNINDYATMKTFVLTNAQALKDAVTHYDTNDKVTRGLQLLADQLNKIVNDADKIIDGVKTTEAGKIEADIAVIEDRDVRANVKYATVVAEAEALKVAENGTCSVEKVNNLNKAINYAKAMIAASQAFTSAEGEAAIAAIKKAANGGTITDADVPALPEDPDTNLKPGNTGLVGSAEGTATTVSIVAGLATALTALGAGVVVYRNARREK